MRQRARNGFYDFNPRSREGSDFYLFDAVNVNDISIRAPARGATTLSDSIGSSVPDFNPRSREGSDCCFLLCYLRICDFNPRSREGSDDNPNYMIQLEKVISIRAPARGATVY